MFTKKEGVIHADETFSKHSSIVVGGVGARQYTFKSLEIKVPYLMFHPDKMKYENLGHCSSSKNGTNKHCCLYDRSCPAVSTLQ